MLPADLDDEQRAHLVHEHPKDLDSIPSSPVPTRFDSRRRPKSASPQRSQTTTNGSESSHHHAHLVSRGENVREIDASLVPTERFELAKLREELKLYKLQLDNAQKEIFRAQDILRAVESQRDEAEADAASARTTARKLREVMLVMLAREEGRRGYREKLRLSMGRRIGYDEEHRDGDENIPELGEATLDEERSHVRLRSAASTRQQPMRFEWAPPVRVFETPLHTPPPPVPSRVDNERVHTPSHENRTASPPRNLDERVHQIPVRPSPLHVWSRDYAYQTSIPPPTPREHTPSVAPPTSTHPSQYDIVNNRPGSAFRNRVYVGRVNSGSQPSRESTSRNEYRDQERRHSSRTVAESITEEWRADDDTSPPPPPNPPRSFVPSTVPGPYRPLNFYYRPREIVTPAPLGDVEDPRSRRPVPTESAAAIRKTREP